MTELSLHRYYQDLGGQFGEVNGMEVVEHFGDPLAEYAALRKAAGVFDLSFRGRLCLTGADRTRFLHGQVTNNVKDLAVGQGCYAALTTAKGKMQSDLNIYCLRDELLLDFEPGLTLEVAQRLDKYIIADDVQVVDMSPHYGLLSVQGPEAGTIVLNAGLNLKLPSEAMSFTHGTDPGLGEIYCMNQPRGPSPGFDLFVPIPGLKTAATKLLSAGAQPAGWQALEILRIESGIPRFGVDMDETNLPPETGIENRAVSYTKGCYIGQEVIARIRTYGQVDKSLRTLRLVDDLKQLPNKGDKLFRNNKEAGFITSAVASPRFKANIALAYIRRESNVPAAELTLHSDAGESPATIMELPHPR